MWQMSMSMYAKLLIVAERYWKRKKDDQEQQTTRKKLRQAVPPPSRFLSLFLYIFLSYVVFIAAEDERYITGFF